MVIKFIVTPEDWAIPFGVTYSGDIKVLFLRMFCFSLAIGKEQ